MQLAGLLIVTNRIPAKTLAIAPARFIPFSSLLKISFSAFLAPVVVCLDDCLPSASASGVAFALLRFRSAAASDWLEICCSCLSFPSSCCGNFELSSAVHVEAGLRSGWGVAGWLRKRVQRWHLLSASIATKTSRFSDLIFVKHRGKILIKEFCSLWLSYSLCPSGLNKVIFPFVCFSGQKCLDRH